MEFIHGLAQYMYLMINFIVIILLVASNLVMFNSIAKLQSKVFNLMSRIKRKNYA